MVSSNKFATDFLTFFSFPAEEETGLLFLMTIGGGFGNNPSRSSAASTAIEDDSPLSSDVFRSPGELGPFKMSSKASKRRKASARNTLIS